MSELLGVFSKGKEQVRNFFQKLADDIAGWLVKNAERFIKVDKSSSTTKELISKYGSKIIKKGKYSMLKKYQKKLKSIVEEANSPKARRKFLEKYKTNKSKSSKEVYITKRIHQFINFEKGAKFEVLFHKFNGGILHPETIRTTITKRVLDVLKKGTMYELKAGYVTVPKNAFTKSHKQLKDFATQVAKDMEILETSRNIKNIEYHIIEGISDDAVMFIMEKAKLFNVENKVKIILYK